MAVFSPGRGLARALAHPEQAPGDSDANSYRHGPLQSE